MNRIRIRSFTYGALLLMAASMAGAQELANLGELLDKGGKRLDAVELKTLLTGATASGMTLRPGSTVEFELTYGADGKANGRLYGPQFNPNYSIDSDMRGTWRINEQQQLCTDLFARAFGQQKACASYYILNNVYYSAASEDRGANVRSRKVTQQSR
ncbi:MAG TPA: hypothetical protein VFS58_01165 [Steroidobacteraceae bacterium]|nr:hypothetical protein [Steroidobacteraceae bacterium]